jgi:hypothetical protein
MKNVFKKNLILGIIVIFLATAIAPGTNADIITNDNGNLNSIDRELLEKLYELELKFFQEEIEEVRLEILDEALALISEYDILPEDISKTEARKQIIDTYNDPSVFETTSNIVTGSLEAAITGCGPDFSFGNYNSMEPTMYQQSVTGNNDLPDLIITDIFDYNIDDYPPLEIQGLKTTIKNIGEASIPWTTIYSSHVTIIRLLFNIIPIGIVDEYTWEWGRNNGIPPGETVDTVIHETMNIEEETQDNNYRAEKFFGFSFILIHWMWIPMPW